MAESQFSIGQRWVSNSEAELGLGIIKNIDGRRIAIVFPAADEQRTYAIDIAPLSRVHYPVGHQVKTNDDVSFTITERHELNGCFVYQGHDVFGKDISIHEMDLDSYVQFSQPEDRLFAGQIDKNSQFELRIETLAHQHRLQQSPVFGLLGARIQLLPHQIYIAHNVANRHAPRVLLADEVGLGKTIEAGLIVHQQIITGQANRILIVVPDSLIHQWLVEMLRRFNLSFTIIDPERFQALSEADETNPFDSAQLVLCGLSTLTSDAIISSAAKSVRWDLLVVDEAHHLQWQPHDASIEYQVVESLAKEVIGLLLLTATPEQLGIESHFARLRLLDPDRYYDLPTFLQQEADYRPVSELVSQLLEMPSQADLVEFEIAIIHYLGEQTFSQLQQSEDFETDRGVAINALLDRHGTGRILFRNTRDVVTGFPKRQLHRYPLPAPDVYLNQSNAADTMALLQPEKLLGQDWWAVDTRVAWLTDWVKQHKKDKLLVICAQASTAQALELFLRIDKGYRTAVFHENLTLVHRDRAAAYFADEEEGAQIMICSEIGSEGRNFQFSHHLVLFDLPLNPDLLEQRIGRLDRIGQRHDVHIHVPYYDTTAQAVLIDWYDLGMNAFEHVFAVGRVIYHDVQDDLHYCLHNTYDEQRIAALIDKTRHLTKQTLNDLHQGRDRLLELNSCNLTVAKQLVDKLEYMSRSIELSDFMDKVWDEFGVEQQPHSADSVIVEPGNHMLHHQFPALPEDGLTATYSRHRALVREDMTFLTWEHPMVLGSIDMVINSEFGNSAFCTLRTDKFTAGTLLIEAIFIMHCPAPQSLRVGRYLNQSYVRLVIDDKGHDYSDVIDQMSFNSLAGRIPKSTAQELVRHARTQITQLIDLSKHKVKTQQQPLIDAALKAMQSEYQLEMTRLTELAKVNPAIRPQEINHLSDSQELLTHHISTAQLTLNALRIAITTETS